MKPMMRREAAALAALVIVSPSLRAWVGAMMVTMGAELLAASEERMTDEQRARGRERMMRAVVREQGRARRNGGRP